MNILKIFKRKTPGKGGSFPEGPKRVPYPNPHPTGEDGGCFPDAPKPPKPPQVRLPKKK